MLGGLIKRCIADGHVLAGVLVLAAVVPAAAGSDYRAVTVGYPIMRIGLVAQWRVGVEDPASKP